MSGTLYTPTLNTVAAAVCGTQALDSAIEGHAWWTLVGCIGAAANTFIAAQTTMRLHEKVDR